MAGPSGRSAFGIRFAGLQAGGVGLKITQEGSPPGQALAEAFLARTHNLSEEGQARMARAHTGAMRTVTAAFLARLREDIVSGGFHNAERLSKTWRGVVYPRNGVSMEAAGYFWTKARTIVEAFDSGVTIRTREGARFLAIPVGPAKAIVRRMNQASNRSRDAFGRFAREAMPVARVEAALGTELVFLPSRNGGGGVLVAGQRLTRTGRASRSQRGAPQTVLFVLVRQVTLRRRIRGRALLDQLGREFPSAFAAALAAEIGSESST